MLHIKTIQKLFITMLMLIFINRSANAQVTPPTWWFGVSGAADFNWYDGTTQRLNNTLIVPAAFHKGFGVRPYGSVLMEYRPAGVWGGMLNVGYDGKGAKFKEVVAPCNCPADLSTNTSYIAVEPSVRLAVPKSNLYFFAGPRLSFTLTRDFSYSQLKQPDTYAQLSEMKKTIISGQVGAGYEIPLSSANSTTKVNLSPFVSYQPYFGQEPRNIESWNVTTVRAGMALKFGKGSKAKEIAETITPPVPAIYFSVRAPKTVYLKQHISETLPLRNSVFFDEGSTEIPARYVALNPVQAAGFKEAQLQNQELGNATGRSARQLNVYHNILNIVGDRLKSNPGTAIILTGAAGNGPAEGKTLAEAVKQYLTANYDIDGSRMVTEGRTKPVIPSEQPGGTKELALLRAGDRRVDITSSSPQLLFEVGGGMMKPVQINTVQADPLDSHVIFNVDNAKSVLQSWTLDLTDDRGTTQHYGPYTTDKETIPGSAILGTNPEGNYKIVMTGLTKLGTTITKESTVRLLRQDEATETGLRYSILFDFNKSNAITAYDTFLTNTVAASIADGATVIIHGHTDIIGDEDHNLTLSKQRAQEVQTILERALAKAGKTNVKFETIGFGEDLNRAPFENSVPEERFYNRTVIIDIVPAGKQ